MWGSEALLVVEEFGTLTMVDRLYESNNLYISGLPLDFDERRLREIFEPYGEILQCRVLEKPGRILNIPSTLRMSAALVRFRHLDEARWILQNLNKNIPEGLINPVKISYEANTAMRTRTDRGSMALHGGRIPIEDMDSRGRYGQASGHSDRRFNGFGKVPTHHSFGERPRSTPYGEPSRQRHSLLEDVRGDHMNAPWHNRLNSRRDGHGLIGGDVRNERLGQRTRHRTGISSDRSHPWSSARPATHEDPLEFPEDEEVPGEYCFDDDVQEAQPEIPPDKRNNSPDDDPAWEKVYIENLPCICDDQVLMDIFEPYGSIVWAKVMSKKDANSPSAALIRFETVEESKWVVENLNGNIPELLDEPITARFANWPGSRARDNLYISGLPADFDEGQLNALFGPYGQISQSRVLPKLPSQPHAVALVRFSSEVDAAWVLENLNDTVPDGLDEPIHIKYADTPDMRSDRGTSGIRIEGRLESRRLGGGKRRGRRGGHRW